MLIYELYIRIGLKLSIVMHGKQRVSYQSTDRKQYLMNIQGCFSHYNNDSAN